MRIPLILASCAALWTAGVAAAYVDDASPEVRQSRASADCSRWSAEQKVSAEQRESYLKACADNHLAMTQPEEKKKGGGED